MKPSVRLLLSCAAALLLAAAAGARAQSVAPPHDHDRARQALESGEILPLRAILERTERQTPGQIMEVELDREDGRWVYEIKVLRAGGSLVKLKLDARDGTVLSSRARGAKGRHQSGDEP